MKHKQIYVRWAIPGSLALVCLLALVAWQTKPVKADTVKYVANDTTPDKARRLERQPGDKDLDLELRQIDMAEQTIKNIDWNKIQQSVDEAMKHVNMDQVNAQVELAMKQIDVNKINEQVQQSLKQIDFDKIERDIEAAFADKMGDLDTEELRQEMAKARKEVANARVEVEKELKNKDWQKEMEATRKEDMKAVQEEMEKAKAEIAKAKVDLAKEKVNMDNDMQHAHAELADVRKEVKGYQEMIYGLEQEGLLSTKGDYTIEYKDEELYVNDKKLSAETSTKYKKYFNKSPVKLIKKNGRIEIRNHNNFD